MNCQQAQKRILLAATGELSSRQARRLEEHVGGCPECGAYRESARALTAQARDALPSGAPSGVTLARIRAAARERAAAPRLIVWRPGVRMLAYAAGLTLVIGGWFLLSSQGRAERVRAVHAIVAVLHAGSTAESAAGTSGAPDLQALARQLLALEGLSAEEAGGTETLEREIIEDEAPPTTGLRSRSTTASPA
jgi:anti-sigma factor RsiW